MKTLTHLPIDPTKIATNPFGDNILYLQRELERFADFFDDIPKDAEELHAAWSRYQKTRGDTAMVQLSLGIDTLTMLDAVHKLLIERGQDGITGLVILFHIALLEQVEQGQYLSFTDWLLGRLKDSDPPLPSETSVGAIREYVKCLEREYESEHGAAKSVIRAFQQGLPIHEKQQLLLAFRFRNPNPPPDTPVEERLGCMHRHCRDRKAAGKHVDPHCLSCPPPADAELDRYIGLLARHLYAMRSVLVHRAMWVWFARIALDVEGLPVSSGTMLDGYFDRKNQFVTYEVTILVEDLARIFRRCIWNRISL